MDKLGRIFFLIPILMLFCSACNDTKSVQTERGVEKRVQAEVFADYQILNDDLFDKDFLSGQARNCLKKEPVSMQRK